MAEGIAPRYDQRRVAIFVGLTAGMIALATYLSTINPTLPPGDSGDLITAASTLGVAHPPGYPLFAMIGHVFTLLPFGSPAFRVNLMSAVLDAAAVAVVAGLIFGISTAGLPRMLEGGGRAVLAAIAGVVGALFLAFSSEFWSYSLVAEVFALNNIFAALLLLLAFAWYREPRRRWVLWGFFLASGLATCNQQTIVLLGPGLGVLLVGGVLRVRAQTDRWLASVVRDFAIGVGFLVVGLVPYLYLPLVAANQPAALWGDPSTFERFIAVITRADYGSFSLLAGGQHGSVTGNLSAFAAYLLDSFGGGGAVFAGLGMVWLARNRPLVAIALVISFLMAGPLFLMFANPPLGGLLTGIFARFYILPSVPLAVIVGCGAFQMAAWTMATVIRIRGAITGGQQLVACALVALLLTALAVGPAVARFASVNQSGNYMTINFIKDLLAPLEPDAILLTEGDTSVLGTLYAQNVEGYRPDVVVIAVPLLRFQWYIDQIRRRHPGMTIPFEAEDVAGKPVTNLIVNANFERRPIYYVGVIPEAFPAGYGELRTGFARRFVRTSDGQDPFAYVRSNLDSLMAYHFPSRLYPPSSWEYWESTHYGGAAFDLANAYETLDVTTAEIWYRRAIELAPRIAGAYKNLAILLNASGGKPTEVADLLEMYLELAPQDPEAAAIKASISRLRGGTP